MTSALLVLLLAAAPTAPAAATKQGHQYPLAAALVHKECLFYVDVPTRTAERVPLADLIPEEADLSQDKALVAVNARPATGKGPAKLFLVKVGAWTLEEIKTDAAGDHRFPHFSADGSYLYFSAAHADAQGGPANPLRIHRLNLKSRAVEEVETTAGNCEFSPVPIAASAVAHITTTCTVQFELATTDLAKRVTRTMWTVPGPATEIAASPDGKRLIEIAPEPAGLGFYLSEMGSKPKRIAGLGYVSEKRLQPRFICPRDIVFVNQNKVWTLDTKSTQITEIIKLPEPKQPERKPQ